MADLTGLMPDTGENPWDLRPAIQAVNADAEARLKTADAAELIRDTIGTALVEGTGIEIAVDDVANTITIGSDGSIDSEVLYEELKGILVEGTGIDISFNDTTKKITITATGGGGGGGGEGVWGLITGTLADQTDLKGALDGKASVSHTHTMADVSDLDGALDDKADVGHTHPITDLTATGTPSAATFLRGDNVWASPSVTIDWGNIAGNITEQTDLLDLFADVAIEIRHLDNESYPRPTTTRPVHWVGSVEPLYRDPSRDTWFETVSGVTFEGPLDDYAATFQAYSLRRLLTSYEGPAIRVRRASDNAEQDIGFTALGELNTTALSLFADTDSVYVKTWYDQSGNARDVTQATAANQPRIVNAGVIDTAGGKPAIVFDGTSDCLTRATTGTTGLWAQGATSMAAVLSGSADTSDAVVSEHGTGTSSIYRIVRTSSANWNIQATNNLGTSLWASTASGSNVFDGNRHQLFYVDAAGSTSTWKDGTAAHNAIATVHSGTFDITAFTLGAHASSSPGGFFTGTMQEVVLWGSGISSVRTAISANQKTYWGTP